MKYFKIYLAGPIGGLSYDQAANGWRKQIGEYFTPKTKRGNVTAGQRLLSAYNPPDKFTESELTDEELQKINLSRYSFDLYSPMRFKDALKGELSLDDRKYTAPLTTPEAVTDRDHNDVYTCDLMIVNFLNCDKISIGTCIEFGWASAYKKSIIVIKDSNNLHDHPMLNSLTKHVAVDLKQAAETATALLVPELN